MRIHNNKKTKKKFNKKNKSSLKFKKINKKRNQL